jgi:hypothetical protein
MHREARDLGQVLQRGPMRMAVLVFNAARDQRDSRPGRGQELWRAAGLRPVMAHLEQVDGRDLMALQQHGLHRRLRVTLQQRREAAAAQQGDDRRVVQVVGGQRRNGIRR